MPVDKKQITYFLTKEEGSVSKGYVPMNKGVPIANSGVTIGTGLDLGQHSYATLEAMDIPDLLIQKFVPYLGKKRMAAVDALKAEPLYLTKAEAEVLDYSVINSYTRAVEDRWNMQPDAKTLFSMAPWQAQVVAVSLIYNLGVRGCPSTFGKIVSGKYKEAIKELRDPNAWKNKELMPRRRREAALLESIKS